MKQTIILVLVACIAVLLLVQLFSSSKRTLQTEVADLAGVQQQLTGNISELQKTTAKLQQNIKYLETSIENLKYSMRRAGTKDDVQADIDLEGDTETADLAASLQEELLAMNTKLEQLSGEISGLRKDRNNNSDKVRNLVEVINEPEKFSLQLDKLAADFSKNIDDENQQYAFQQDIDRLKEMADKIDDPDLYDHVIDLLDGTMNTTTSVEKREWVSSFMVHLSSLQGEELQKNLEGISTRYTIGEVYTVAEKYNIPAETMEEYGLPIKYK